MQLQLALQSRRDQVGFNMAALKILKRKMESEEAERSRYFRSLALDFFVTELTEEQKRVASTRFNRTGRSQSSSAAGST